MRVRTWTWAASAAMALIAQAGCGLTTVSGEAGTPEAGTAGGNVPVAVQATTTPADDANTPAPQPSVVTLSGTLFTPHIGQRLGAALIDPNMDVVAQGNTMVDSGGNFTLAFPNTPVLGKGYVLEYYADLNKNGFCNAPPTDHSWSVEVPSVGAATTVDVVHNDTWVPVCEAFGAHSLTFMGIDFTGHQAQTFYISTVDNADHSLVGQVLSGVIPATGKVMFGWPTLLLAGHSYTVSYFADVNGNKTCDNADHAWMQGLPAATGDVTLTGDHNSPQTKVCQNFPTGVLSPAP